jgi:RNA polymerase sigma-70 factor (ECF subfamily)
VDHTEQDIIQQVLGGNTRWYALLVDRHKDRALTLAVRLLGDRQEAEDLLQDAFIKAFKSLDQFRGEAKFGTWFYRILYNLGMTRVRRRRERGVSLESADSQEYEQVLAHHDEPSIQERLENEEVQLVIDEVIAGLPEKFKSVITLFYVQEMSYEEIATVLDTPLGTVKTNLFRARSMLKERVLGRMKGEMNAA